MNLATIDALVNFHSAVLQECRFAMSPAAIQLEEETVKALELLKAWSSIIPEGDTGVTTDRR